MRNLETNPKRRPFDDDAINRFMFGDRYKAKQPEKPAEEDQMLDIQKWMEHSDVLMSTFNELSPYLKKIPNLISKFTNILK